jgi:CelD/BcsL family acetyltransferase involved in cellulose biosynthesis
MNRFKLAEIDRGFDGTSLAAATITIYPSLAAAESAWRAAVKRCACFVFQTFEWNATWRETVGRGATISEQVIHLTAADGRTLMLLPFAIRQTPRLRVLEFLGGSLTDYNAPLIDADFAYAIGDRQFARLWRAMTSVLPAFDAVWLVRMPKTIDGASNPLAALSWVRHTDDAYAARLPESFKEFTATRSTQFFAQIRRHRRRLEKHGDVNVSFPAEPGERLEVIRVLADQKSSWLRSNGYDDPFRHEATREFYERLAAQQPQAGRILVACLRVGDQVAAALWGAVFGRRYYFLLPSYSEAWKNYSAGRILTESVLQRCIDQGDVSVFDLTIGDEGYKRVWSDHSLALHEYLEARTAKGLAFVWYRRLRSAIRSNRRIRELTRAVTSRLRARTQNAPVGSEAGA